MKYLLLHISQDVRDVHDNLNILDLEKYDTNIKEDVWDIILKLEYLIEEVDCDEEAQGIRSS